LKSVAEPLASTIQGAAHRLTGAAADYDPLLAVAGAARFVLLGEASHGTHEFYRARAEITRRLIVERGFTAVAAEAEPESGGTSAPSRRAPRPSAASAPCNSSSAAEAADPR
jgi:erythromycin esterase-like protein